MMILLTACGYSNTVIPKAIGEGRIELGGLNYSSVKAAVFEPHCIRCHGSSGGVSLTSYASVVNSLSRIQAAVNSGAMPPSGALPQDTKNLLNQWISAGAPETGQGSAGGTVTGGASGGAGGGTGDDSGCEDDRRLIDAGIVSEVGEGKVYDLEREVIRHFRNGCRRNI